MTARREMAAEIEDVATQWVIRLDRDGRTAEAMAELKAWLAEDSRHEGAFLQAEAVWLFLDRAADSGAEPEDLGREAIFSWAGRRGIMLFAAAAAVIAMVFGTVLLTPSMTYETRFGETRRVPLADGSVTAINSESKLAVDLQLRERRVELIKGEAWFQVYKDAHRPFTVSVGRVRVQAVGTAFSVRRYDNGADVLVTEGVVKVWASGAEGHHINLAVGDRAFVGNDAAIIVAHDNVDSIERELAWRTGTISLRGDRLEQVIREFNRYNYRRLILADPGLANERFHGVFRIDDPEGFANAVHSILEVPVDASGRGEIRIGARSRKIIVETPKEVTSPGV